MSLPQIDSGVLVKDKLYSILIGGKAGEGVKKVAQVIGKMLCQQGRQVIQMDDYQSLIKGGHNFSVVTSAPEPVFATYRQQDLIICFDLRSALEHYHQLKPGGKLFYNSD